MRTYPDAQFAQEREQYLRDRVERELRFSGRVSSTTRNDIWRDAEERVLAGRGCYSLDRGDIVSHVFERLLREFGVPVEGTWSFGRGGAA